MLNLKDMTETARAVFNALSNEPATVGEIAQNTHLTRERCQFNTDATCDGRLIGLSVWML
ncbi:Uncharacterised protein [Raoultella ornithinolytica]|nr:Uncharacterised protein [Raoultella ornithinolytica]